MITTMRSHMLKAHQRRDQGRGDMSKTTENMSTMMVPMSSPLDLRNQRGTSLQDHGQGLTQRPVDQERQVLETTALSSQDLPDLYLDLDRVLVRALVLVQDLGQGLGQGLVLDQVLGLALGLALITSTAQDKGQDQGGVSVSSQGRDYHSMAL